MLNQLTSEELKTAKAFNARARQIFWRGAVPQTCPVWNMSETEEIEWTLEYQLKHGLLADGRLGPSTMICLMASQRSGIGGLIIGGKEIEVKDLIVARMFVPNPSLKTVDPKIVCLLSQGELDRETRERVHGGARVRSHFSIDSSRGQKGKSLIIQWADPLRDVGFCPTNETLDYPKNISCIGIEIENVLLQYQLDMDERRWMRRRSLVKAEIAGSSASQPIYHPEQIQSLQELMAALESHCGIPRAFPLDNGRFDTACRDASIYNEHHGYLARFNYYQKHNEPGAGLIEYFPKIFDYIEPEETQTKQKKEIEMLGDSYVKEKAQDLQKLQAQANPTPSFKPQLDSDPRFNLSQAITLARGGAKQSRASRLIQRFEGKKEEANPSEEIPLKNR